MLEPGICDLTLEIGTTFGAIQVTCLDSEGDPVSLVGCELFAEARAHPTGELIVDLNPQIDGEPTAGIIRIPEIDTSLLTISPGNYRWDLIVQSPDTKIKIVKGAFRVERATTHVP